MDIAPTRFTISDHAFERFRERFAHIELPIGSLLENSILFGGQKGSDYLLLNKEYEVVFPVAVYEGKHAVKTILTLQQAKANLSLINKTISFESDLRERCEELRRQHQEEIKRQPQVSKEVSKEEEEIINKLKNLARKYLSNMPQEHRGCPGPHQAKCLKKKIKKKLPISNTQFDKFFIGEIGRIIRESDWSCLNVESNGEESSWLSIEELLDSCA